MKTTLYLLLTLALYYSPSALAYVDPGLGAGALASILGIAAGIGMLAIGVIWYPLKRLFRKVRSWMR